MTTVRPRLRPNTVVVDLEETVAAAAGGTLVYTATPQNWAVGGLVALVDRVAERTGHDGTLVVTERTAQVLQLSRKPRRPRPGMPAWCGRRDGSDHVWQCDTEHPCMVWMRDDGRRMYVWVAPWAGKEPMVADPDPFVVGLRFARFHELVGGPYVGPNMTGVALLRDRYAPRHQPFWRPDYSKVPPAQEAAESPWVIWDAPHQPRDGFLHQWDSNANHIALLINVDLAADALRHDVKYHPLMAGYCQITRQPWTETRLPDPIGPGRDDVPVGGRVWVATPTVVLLTELSERGMYGGVEIHDTWLAPGRRVTRALGETLRDARAEVVLSDDPDEQAVASAIRGTYSFLFGMMIKHKGEGKGRLARADWYHCGIAKQRANLFRTLLKGMQYGKFPARIRTDCISYHEPIGTALCAYPWMPYDHTKRLGYWKPARVPVVDLAREIQDASAVV